MTDHPIVAELTKLQYDLTGMQARLTEIKRQVAALDITPASDHVCEDCAGLSFPGPRKLAEHRYVTHNGAVPDHWQAAEARAETEVGA